MFRFSLLFLWFQIQVQGQGQSVSQLAVWLLSLAMQLEACFRVVAFQGSRVHALRCSRLCDRLSDSHEGFPKTSLETPSMVSDCYYVSENPMYIPTLKVRVQPLPSGPKALQSRPEM